MKKLDEKENSTGLEGKALIKAALRDLHKDNPLKAKEDFNSALNCFKKANSIPYISVCLSFLGLTDYIIDKNNNQNSLALMHDGA